MKPIENHDEIVTKCLELDEKAKKEELLIYYLSAAPHTFKLGWIAVSWSFLATSERYCMVKYGNLFFSQEEAEAACKRIFE